MQPSQNEMFQQYDIYLLLFIFRLLAPQLSQWWAAKMCVEKHQGVFLR